MNQELGRLGAGQRRWVQVGWRLAVLRGSGYVMNEIARRPQRKYAPTQNWLFQCQKRAEVESLPPPWTGRKTSRKFGEVVPAFQNPYPELGK